MNLFKCYINTVKNLKSHKYLTSRENFNVFGGIKSVLKWQEIYGFYRLKPVLMKCQRKHQSYQVFYDTGTTHNSKPINIDYE